MTDVLDPPIVPPIVLAPIEPAHEQQHGPTGILKWITSTDHKVIGMSYTVTATIMMVIGGAFAEIIRAQLTSPNGTLVSFAQYNEALKLDPMNRHAHEYIGEAYLLTDNLPKAEHHLAELQRICSPIPCEEYKELKRAVDAYRKAKK